MLLFLSSIFYSSAQLECIRFLSVLSVSTYRHVFPYWVSVTSSSNVYPVSVCYHSFWTPVSTCLPIFPLISSFQSCPKWIGLIFDIHILLSIHLSPPTQLLRSLLASCKTIEIWAQNLHMLLLLQRIFFQFVLYEKTF